MEKSIDELLGDEPDFDAVEDNTPAVIRDGQGRFAKEKGVEPADEPEQAQTQDEVPPTPDRLPPDTFKAVKDEREKRQQLERELTALREQFQAQQNPPPPPPNIWEDEQGALDHVKNEAISTAVQQATFNAKLDMSEMMVRQANPDFDDMKARFLQLAEMNPSLRQQALSDPHPWNKAYQIAKNAATMEELGATDIETLRAKLREELAAEMQIAPRATGLPPTLTNERNVGNRTGPAWAGPRSLSELLG